jgi:hypothetical protein
MCLPGLRAGHESELRRLVSTMYRHFHGSISDDLYVRFLRNRDRELWLEVESNCFLGYRPDLVARAFPDARFIVPVREPRSWLRSMLHNHMDYRPRAGTAMEMWHAVFFPSRNDPHDSREQVLRQESLYPIHAYLNYWAAHNHEVLTAMRGRHHLVIGTGEISDSLGDIASFLAVAPARLDASGAHSNRTATRRDVLSDIDPDFLSATIDRICGPVVGGHRLDRLFEPVDTDRPTLTPSPHPR